MNLVELDSVRDPVQDCYARIRDACLMSNVSQANKIAALELVKAGMLHDMLAEILDARD